MPRLTTTRRLPREAMWFFVAAPPALALLFDPTCARSPGNVLRAWVALTMVTTLTGLCVHLTFDAVASRMPNALPLRLVAHVASTVAVVTGTMFLLHPILYAIYPEVGRDRLGNLWRGIVVAFGYLATARFVGLLQERAVAERTAALEARLASLQAQMQPHFLFNSLNVCAGLVHSRPDVAEATLDKLAGFLRYTIESSEQRLVPLADELEAMTAYLAIQRERFGDRLRHEIVAPAAGERVPMLPPMVLQPLVENALHHGLDDEAGGLVRVACRTYEGHYEIAVEDSGGATHARRGTGTGQRSVRERLHLVYGQAAELRCGPSEEGGYRSVISIPLSATA